MMKSMRILACLCALVLTGATAKGQFYKLHNADVGGGVLGQFTTPLPAGNSSNVTAATSNDFGGMFTLRDHPVSWAGLEFNYAFTDYHTYFRAPYYAAAPKTNAHEATAAYLFHPHFRRLQPFVAVGGGYIDFVPSTQGQNQWRGTGLIETGLDIPTMNPHWGFRIQGRTLIYRQTDFNQANLASRQWVATSEPSLGFWYRF